MHRKNIFSLSCLREDELQVSVFILKSIFLIFFLNCSISDPAVKETDILGLWKEVSRVSGDSNFSRESILFHFRKKDKDSIEAVIVGLDHALEENNMENKNDSVLRSLKLRSCSACEADGRQVTLLNYPIIQELQKSRKGYSGKIYDLYWQKWLTVSVKNVYEKRMELRAYAGFPISGKNIYLEKADEEFQKLIQSAEKKKPSLPGNYYAVSLDLPFENKTEVIKSLDEESFQIADTYGRLYPSNANLKEISERSSSRVLHQMVFVKR